MNATPQRGVGAGPERQHLQADVVLPGQLGQPVELAGQHLRSADLAAQRGLVQQHVQARRLGPGQQLLPAQPQRDPALDVGRRDLRGRRHDRPRVRRCLQQAGHQRAG
ncbi:MAG TPA: hypothetical protein VLM05_14250, partial [Mycobacteriales bacterium]|nr:hypothetical protein [Mycobacteriales bacterium]